MLLSAFFLPQPRQPQRNPVSFQLHHTQPDCCLSFLSLSLCWSLVSPARVRHTVSVPVARFVLLLPVPLRSLRVMPLHHRSEGGKSAHARTHARQSRATVVTWSRMPGSHVVCGQVFFFVRLCIQGDLSLLHSTAQLSLAMRPSDEGQAHVALRVR